MGDGFNATVASGYARTKDKPAKDIIYSGTHTAKDARRSTSSRRKSTPSTTQRTWTLAVVVARPCVRLSKQNPSSVEWFVGATENENDILRFTPSNLTSAAE